MKLLIIGSQGFIGSNCLRFFSEKFPEWNVWGCDITVYSQPKYIKVSPEKPDYRSIFSKHSFDICINASGSGSVGFSIENPEKDYELNVRNVEMMLDAIRQCNPACKFINFSSAAVYGNPVKLPVKESDSLNPISPYGKHKLESEKILAQYYMEYNIPTCSLRVFSAYGPGLKKQIFWDIWEKSKKNKEVKLFGTGNETRDFIYITDLAEAVNWIIKRGYFQGEAINVASGAETAISDAAGTFAKLLNPELIIKFTGQSMRGAPLHWKADIKKLSALGFSQRTNIVDGLNQYCRWLRTSA